MSAVLGPFQDALENGPMTVHSEELLPRILQTLSGGIFIIKLSFGGQLPVGQIFCHFKFAIGPNRSDLEGDFIEQLAQGIDPAAYQKLGM
jgi:hypothetical protein